MDEESKALLKQIPNSSNEVEKLKLQLAQPSTSSGRSEGRRKRIVLEEDEYREKLGKIIERDFFPNVEKLRFELEYDQAVEANDFEKVRLLNSIRESMANAGSETPAGFETPTVREQCFQLKKDRNDKAINKEEDANEISLNKFLNKYTSEDNDSLKQLLDADKLKKDERMKFISKDSESVCSAVDRMIELPSIDEQRALKNGPGNTENRSVTWKHVDRNNVMFPPIEAPLTAKEIADRASAKPVVNHENTRFKRPNNIFPPTVATQSSNASNITAPLNTTGRVGIDGNVIANPSVGGFNFVPGTPFIDPNHLDTPNQMTWGTIDATPVRIEDGNATPRTGAFFKIPEITKREITEQELHQQVLGKKRKAANSAVQSLNSSKSSRPGSSHDRLATMSPAARLLASSTLRIGSSNDRSLRASYSTFSRSSSSREAPTTATPSPVGARNHRPSRTPTPKR